MIDECPMTEDCPGFDRDRRVCLLRPGDCELAPADGEADLVFEGPEGPPPRPPEAASRSGRPALAKEALQ